MSEVDIDSLPLMPSWAREDYSPEDPLAGISPETRELLPAVSGMEAAQGMNFLCNLKKIKDSLEYLKSSFSPMNEGGSSFWKTPITGFSLASRALKSLKTCIQRNLHVFSTDLKPFVGDFLAQIVMCEQRNPQSKIQIQEDKGTATIIVEKSLVKPLQDFLEQEIAYFEQPSKEESLPLEKDDYNEEWDLLPTDVIDRVRIRMKMDRVGTPCPPPSPRRTHPRTIHELRGHCSWASTQQKKQDGDRFKKGHSRKGGYPLTLPSFDVTKGEKTPRPMRDSIRFSGERDVHAMNNRRVRTRRRALMELVLEQVPHVEHVASPGQALKYAVDLRKALGTRALSVLEKIFMIKGRGITSVRQKERGSFLELTSRFLDVAGLKLGSHSRILRGDEILGELCFSRSIEEDKSKKARNMNSVRVVCIDDVVGLDRLCVEAVIRGWELFHNTDKLFRLSEKISALKPKLSLTIDAENKGGEEDAIQMILEQGQTRCISLFASLQGKKHRGKKLKRAIGENPDTANILLYLIYMDQEFSKVKKKKVRSHEQDDVDHERSIYRYPHGRLKSHRRMGA